MLVACGRLPEAAFFARTYRPSRCSEMLALWKADLRGVNARVVTPGTIRAGDTITKID